MEKEETDPINSSLDHHVLSDEDAKILGAMTARGAFSQEQKDKWRAEEEASMSVASQWAAEIAGFYKANEQFKITDFFSALEDIYCRHCGYLQPEKGFFRSKCQCWNDE